MKCHLCDGTGTETWYHDDNRDYPTVWHSRKCTECGGTGEIRTEDTERAEAAEAEVARLRQTLDRILDAHVGVDLWSPLDGQLEGIEAAVAAAETALGEASTVLEPLPDLTDENLARVTPAALDAWFERRGWVREEKPGLWGSTHSWYPPGVVGSCISEVPVPPVHSPMYVYELRNTLRHIYLYDVEIFAFSRRMMLTELLADSQPPLRKDDDAVPA